MLALIRYASRLNKSLQMSSLRVEILLPTRLIMWKQGSIWIRDVLRIRLLCLRVVHLVLKVMFRLLCLIKLKIMVVKMILMSKLRFLIVLSRCSLKKLYIVLNGQEIFSVSYLPSIPKLLKKLSKPRVWMLCKVKKERQ